MTNTTAAETEKKIKIEIGETALINTGERYLHVSFEKITPEIARKYVELNISNNRKLSPTNQSRLDNGMSNHWIVNGDAIRFNEYGKLIDGNHRLNTCIKTGVSFETLVVRNLDKRALDTIDTGKSRNSVDIFKINEIENSKIMANLCKNLVWYFKNIERLSNRTYFKTPDLLHVSSFECLDFYNKNKAALCNIHDSLKSRIQQNVRLTLPVYLFKYVLERINPDKTIQFYEDVENFLNQIIFGTNIKTKLIAEGRDFLMSKFSERINSFPKNFSNERSVFFLFVVLTTIWNQRHLNIHLKAAMKNISVIPEWHVKKGELFE